MSVTRSQKQRLRQYPAAALSITQFCIDHDISLISYYKLKEQGLGPKEMRLGERLVRISQESAAEWRNARANPKGQEAKRVAKNALAIQAQGKHAAKIAIQSPRHVSNRGGR